MELFKEFKSWPEYNESNFLATMNDLSAHHEFIEFEDNLKIDEWFPRAIQMIHSL